MFKRKLKEELEILLPKEQREELEAALDSLQSGVGRKDLRDKQFESELLDLEDQIMADHQRSLTMSAAMCGDMVLSLGSASEDVAASDLNAAAAGALSKKFSVRLETSKKDLHWWCGLALTLSAAEAVADAEVAAPSLPAEVKLKQGAALVKVTFDTDAGATKTYAAGDSVSVDVQVASDDKLLGHLVTKVTKTYNVV